MFVHGRNLGLIVQRTATEQAQHVERSVPVCILGSIHVDTSSVDGIKHRAQVRHSDQWVCCCCSADASDESSAPHQIYQFETGQLRDHRGLFRRRCKFDVLHHVFDRARPRTEAQQARPIAVLYKARREPHLTSSECRNVRHPSVLTPRNIEVPTHSEQSTAAGNEQWVQSIGTIHLVPQHCDGDLDGGECPSVRCHNLTERNLALYNDTAVDGRRGRDLYCDLCNVRWRGYEERVGPLMLRERREGAVGHVDGVILTTTNRAERLTSFVLQGQPLEVKTAAHNIDHQEDAWHNFVRTDDDQRCPHTTCHGHNADLHAARPALRNVKHRRERPKRFHSFRVSIKRSVNVQPHAVGCPHGIGTLCTGVVMPPATFRHKFEYAIPGTVPAEAEIHVRQCRHNDLVRRGFPCPPIRVTGPAHRRGDVVCGWVVHAR
eukprot:PhM_4_TR10195/c0_g2_i1/m.79748